MANTKKAKTKKNKNGMHGRRVSGWQIAILSVLVALIALFAVGYVFINTYVPAVDTHPHFVQSGTSGDLSVASRQGIYKFHISRALKLYREDLQNKLGAADSRKIVRVDGIYNFLLLGHDRVALNTDVIMIASFNTNDGRISIMQLPRDTYIEHDGYAHKINAMFAYLVGRARAAGATNVYHTALENYCEVLENALSIELDNYALINLQAFESIVDTVGGVPIDVPEAMHYEDEFQDLSIHIEAGPQVLDGKTAAGFVRFRSGYINADIGRQDAQKIFMTAFLKRVQETISVNTVAKITEQAIKNLTTDMTITDAAYYAKEALSADLSNINMMSLPGEAIYANGISYYVLYRNSTLDIINKYFNVYNVDISDEMFDRDLLFTDKNSPKIENIYRNDDAGYVVNNGENIDQSGIYIPRYYGLPEQDETDTEPVEELGVSDTYEDSEESQESDESSELTEADLSEQTDSSEDEPSEDEYDTVESEESDEELVEQDGDEDGDTLEDLFLPTEDSEPESTDQTEDMTEEETEEE